MLDADNIAEDGERRCATIDVMRANTAGFITGSDRCPNGVCNASMYKSCKRSAKDVDLLAYGPGSDYKINSNEPFQVYAQFMTEEGVTYENLNNVKVTLSQGENKVEIFQDCGRDYLEGFAGLMKRGYLGTVISHSPAATIGTRNWNEFDKQCSTSCDADATMHVSDFTWWETDSKLDDRWED